MALTATIIPNQCEIHMLHKEKDGTLYPLTCQHADVHNAILSVTHLVTMDCEVTFYKSGGYIKYPTGKKLHYVAKYDVFFVLLNVVHPDVQRRGAA